MIVSEESDPQTSDAGYCSKSSSKRFLKVNSYNEMTESVTQIITMTESGKLLFRWQALSNCLKGKAVEDAKPLNLIRKELIRGDEKIWKTCL